MLVNLIYWDRFILKMFGDSTMYRVVSKSGEYASMSYIENELAYAEELFRKNKRWPIFNVTERALEETASEITRIVASRMGWPDSALF